MIENVAQALFEVWRTDQTGDVWRQLREDEREAWRRVARAVCGPGPDGLTPQ